ncbi:MAG TPA: cobalamin-binding protein [Dehalococcoidia bacterium]|nr:cobalamin-binding protein [Dehalococcoidia bacterium]
MATEERTKEILKALDDAVYNFEEDDAVKWSQASLDEGVDPFVAIMEGLATGMQKAGDAYNNKEYFVPELLMCSDAMYAGLGLLRPAVLASGRKSEVKGSLVIGVVEGDVHDIGKNLVKMMFDVAGWNVYDLGKDVPLDKFVEEQMKTDSDVVALSAMMTTSMLGMPVVIKKLRARNPNIRIMIGGAPINPEVADKYGADGYAESAGTAVDEAMGLLKMLKEEEMSKK